MLYGPKGYYLDCDTAVCAECAPEGFEDANYSEWSGFEGWDEPIVIGYFSEPGDSDDYCAEWGEIIQEGLSSLVES